MTQHSLGRGIAAAVVVFQLAGCGGADPAGEQLADSSAEHVSHESSAPSGDAGVAGAEQAAAAAPQQPTAAEPPFALSVADVAAYERGLRREIELLESAQQRIREAQSDEQQLEILGEIQPQALRREGAAAAGVSEQRYRSTSDAVDDVLGKLDMIEAARQMMPSAADLAELPEEFRAQVEENARQMQAAYGDPYEGLDAAVAEALEASSAALRQLRAERLGLLFNVAQ